MLNRKDNLSGFSCLKTSASLRHVKLCPAAGSLETTERREYYGNWLCLFTSNYEGFLQVSFIIYFSLFISSAYWNDFVYLFIL